MTYRCSRYGVDGTDIPVGTLVRYDRDSAGPDSGVAHTWIMQVRERNGVKVLGFPDPEYGLDNPDNFIHGQNGTITPLDNR